MRGAEFHHGTDVVWREGKEERVEREKSEGERKRRKRAGAAGGERKTNLLVREWWRSS